MGKEVYLSLVAAVTYRINYGKVQIDAVRVYIQRTLPKLNEELS